MSKLFIALLCFWHFHVLAEKFTVASQNFNYFPHYNFLSETDKGFIWAVLDEFSKYSGHQFTYQPMPVLRLQRELEKGSIDLVYPDNPLFNNNQTFAKGKYYSDTVVNTLGGTMVRSQSVGKNINFIKRLSIPLGFTPQLQWADLIAQNKVKLIQVATPLAELQLLAMNRVDAAEVDYFVSQYQMLNNPEFKGFRFDPRLPHSEVEFKLSTIQQIWLIDEINEFMESQPQVIKQLKLRYGISEPQLILNKLNQTTSVD